MIPQPATKSLHAKRAALKAKIKNMEPGVDAKLAKEKKLQNITAKIKAGGDRKMETVGQRELRLKARLKTQKAEGLTNTRLQARVKALKGRDDKTQARQIKPPTGGGFGDVKTSQPDVFRMDAKEKPFKKGKPTMPRIPASY